MMVVSTAMQMMGVPLWALMMMTTAVSEAGSDRGIRLGDVLEAGAVAYATAEVVPAPNFSGMGSNLIGANVGATLQNIGAAAVQVGEHSAVTAGIQTALGGGSFASAFEANAIMDIAAIGAGAIGANVRGGSFESIGLHALLGCASSAALGTGCAGGAIGGAASAAFSPDFIKAIDPTGTVLDPGQQAALAGFATLLGGGLAGLAGANAQGGATAAQNEALNNSGAPADVKNSAENGGWLSKAGAFLSSLGNDAADQLASAGRGAVNMGNQFIGLMNANSGQTPPSDPNPLVSASNGGNPPATGGAVVTPPAYAMTPEGPVPIAPGVVVPGLSPGNAILSSNGNDSGTGAGASGAGSAGGGGGLSAADQLAANKAAGAAFEQAVEAQLSQSGYTIGQQVTIETESGVRTRLDFLTLDPLTGDVSCVECKASSTAPLTTNQKLAFPEIAQSGGTVVGAGKPGFPGGTTIPPTTVQIIRGP